MLLWHPLSASAQTLHCLVLPPPPPASLSRSPLNLLQESYPDPYQHIVCCVLCSRTSGSGVISAAVAAFFDALPTPSAVLEAPGKSVSQSVLAEVVDGASHSCVCVTRITATAGHWGFTRT